MFSQMCRCGIFSDLYFIIVNKLEIYIYTYYKDNLLMVHVVHAIIKEVRPVLLIFDVFRYISSNHVPL